jgi:hypothetical protein
MKMAAPVLKTYFQNYTTDNLGQIDLTGILSVKSHSTIHVELLQWPDTGVHMTAQCDIGKIAGTTVAQTLEQFPLGGGGQIHSFNVIGPEFRVVLTGGPSNTAVPIQGWVFLH